MNYLMMGLSFLDDKSDCLNGLDLEGANGDKFLGILKIARIVVQFLQIVVPIVLIVWGTLDFGKAVIEGDEKKMKEKRKPFLQRVISAIIVFLIPYIVVLILNLVNAKTWYSCWKAASSSEVTNVVGDDFNTMDPQ